MVSRVTPRSRWELPILAVILLLATVLRVGWPSLTEFKFSEARLAALALELTQEGHLPLVGVPSSAGFDHSPISVYLYVPAFLFGADPIPATIFGGLVGVAAVALGFCLARRWPGGGAWAATVTMLLFAVSPWLVSFSRKIWQVTFVPFLTLAFVGLMVSALVGGRRWHLAWALITFAVLVQTHPSAASLAPAVLIWLLLFRRQVRAAPLLVGAIAGALTAVPMLAHQASSGWPAVAALRSLPGGVTDLSSLRMTWEVITGLGISSLAGKAYPQLRVVPQLSWTFNSVGWLAVIASLALAGRTMAGWTSDSATRREAGKVDVILLSWLVFPVVVNLRHSLDMALHFFVLVAPAAYLLIGRAVQAALGAYPSRAAKALTMGSLVLLAAAQVSALIMMGRFVAAYDTSGGFGTTLRDYRALAAEAVEQAVSAQAAEVLVVGRGDSPIVDEVPAIFDIMLRNRTTYRFVDGRSTAVFPPHKAVALLAPEAGRAAFWYDPWVREDLGGGYRLAQLSGTSPSPDPAGSQSEEGCPAGLHPVSGLRLLNSGVELQGYCWNGGAPGMAQGELWLLWQVLWRDLQDTHFFVRLVDQAGRVQAQQDSVGYPVEDRGKGDRILSKFDITFSEPAPAAPLLAQAGLYLFPEIVNVPVIDDLGQPVADAVTLGPLGLTEMGSP